MLDVTTQNNKRTIGQWAKIIRGDFGKTVEGLITAGQHLTEAKAELDHGDFLPLLDRLKIKQRTAQALMQIVRNPALVKSAHGAYLPASISTLARLSDSSPDLIEKWIAEGAITPEFKRSDLPKAKPSKPVDHSSPGGPGEDEDTPIFDNTDAGRDDHQSPWQAHGVPEPDDEPRTGGDIGQPAPIRTLIYRRIVDGLSLILASPNGSDLTDDFLREVFEEFLTKRREVLKADPDRWSEK